MTGATNHCNNELRERTDSTRRFAYLTAFAAARPTLDGEAMDHSSEPYAALMRCGRSAINPMKY